LRGDVSSRSGRGAPFAFADEEITMRLTTAPRPADGGGSAASGGTDSRLLRLSEAAYADGLGLMAADRPNPRAISNAIFQQTEDMPSTLGYSNMLWVWGQFLDHDMSLTEAHGDGAAAPIPVPAGDPFFDPFGTGAAAIGFTRVKPVEGTGVVDADGAAIPRAYVNEITVFLDASNVYGSTAAQLADLRAEGGKLRLDDDGLILFEDGAAVAGDARAGENIALNAMHALFAREHNRLVDALRPEMAETLPDLSDDALDEVVFQEARARVEAILQAITYNDFLPKLVGEDAIAAYRGYDPDVDPQVSVEFTTAVFRLGHTMLSPTLARMNEAGEETAGGDVSLRDAFFAPEKLAEEGVDPLFRGLSSTFAQEIDTFVVEDVRSFLFGPPGAGGFDLVSLNIQRGRDLGVPTYNDLRAALGLTRAETFEDITGETELAAKLAAVYGDVDLVDAWVGGLAEEAVEGGALGELFSTVIIDQFTRLRDGDPFWSEGRGFAAGELDALWSTRLSDVILRNTDIEHIQDDVFLTYARQGGDEGRNRLVGDGGRDLLIGFGGDDHLDGRGGDDHLAGGDGRDYLQGGEGDDVLLGGDGADRMFGGDGDDRLEGGEGRDWMYGDAGDDILIGGDGDDMLSGGDGNDLLSGGAGRDRFMFYATESGSDVIEDFEAGDILYIVGGSSFGGVTLSVSGDDVVAQVADLFVTLEDVALALVEDGAMFT
jgi:hypothetical protein